LPERKHQKLIFAPTRIVAQASDSCLSERKSGLNEKALPEREFAQFVSCSLF